MYVLILSLFCVLVDNGGKNEYPIESFIVQKVYVKHFVYICIDHLPGDPLDSKEHIISDDIEPNVQVFE